MRDGVRRIVSEQTAKIGARRRGITRAQRDDPAGVERPCGVGRDCDERIGGAARAGEIARGEQHAHEVDASGDKIRVARDRALEITGGTVEAFEPGIGEAEVVIGGRSLRLARTQGDRSRELSGGTRRIARGERGEAEPHTLNDFPVPCERAENGAIGRTGNRGDARIRLRAGPSGEKPHEPRESQENEYEAARPAHALRLGLDGQLGRARRLCDGRAFGQTIPTVATQFVDRPEQGGRDGRRQAGREAIELQRRSASEPDTAETEQGECERERNANRQTHHLCRTVSRTREELLKAALVAALLVLASPARSDGANDLVVGTVRDRSGAPIVAADVRAFDAAGALRGSDSTDGLGTFAVHLRGPATTLLVTCPHCRGERVAIGEDDVAIVVTRYDALDRDVPDESDLDALPYGRIVDALALVPYALTSRGTRISDRGLGSANGLVVDNGAPLVDGTTGSSALIDFPNRATRRIALEPPTHAFRYGPGAGGGTFELDTLGDPGVILDGGRANALDVEGAFGALHPGSGVSNDAGLSARRADLDVTTPFAGGFLRAGTSLGSERLERVPTSSAFARDVSLVHAAYATASRRYRTFASFSLANVALAFASAGGNDAFEADRYRAAYASASLRVEKPGPLALAFGAFATLGSGLYVVNGTAPYTLTGSAASTTAYVEAHTSGATRIDAGLGFVATPARETLATTSARGTRLALLPSLDVRRDLGGGAYLRTAYSESQRSVTLVEAEALSLGTLAIERGELLESAIGFDDGRRIRAEGIAYREFTHGFAERRLDGLGANVVWQLAPLVSLRAWTLRASPLDANGSLPRETDAGRQVLWLTYRNPAALRFDALLSREATFATHATIALDGDLLVPLSIGASIHFGTVRHDGARRYDIGLRFP